MTDFDKEIYYDRNGKRVKVGDKIRFTLHDGILNKEAVVRQDRKMNDYGILGLWPPTMKYLEFEIIEDEKHVLGGSLKDRGIHDNNA